jgi:hypothetical protein
VTYQYQNVWKKLTPELITEITAFWASEKALPETAQATRRAEHAVVLMRDENNAIAGVSTAMVKLVPRLRQPLYHYHSFCSAQHRSTDTIQGLLQASQNALHEFNKGLEKHHAIGMIIEVDNKNIQSIFTEASCSKTGFNFMGFSPRKLPLRVHYFPGFKLQAPAILPQDKKNAQASKKQAN